MTVYVDDMYLRPMGQYKQMKMSHMIADTEEELHHMAKKIGLKRKWFQGDHYDVSLLKREKALRNGAISITLRECSQMCFVRKVTGKLPRPERAEKRWKAIQKELLEKGKAHLTRVNRIREERKKKTEKKVRVRLKPQRIRLNKE